MNYGNRMLETLFPNGVRARIPGLPLDMGQHSIGIRYQPPRLGEDTRAILAEAGYTAAQISELTEQRVVIEAGALAPSAMAMADGET